MSVENDKREAEADRATPAHDDRGTKPSGQEVGPPKERVDDETSVDDGKTTRRQE